MAIRDTLDQLTVDIIAHGTSAAQSRFVQVRMSTREGKTSDKVFELSSVSADPRPLSKMASDLGVAILRPARKLALFEKFENAVAAADANPTTPTFEPVLQPGWYGDAFVTPRKVYGEGERKIVPVFAGVPLSLTYHRRGSLEDWKGSVGRMLKGNPLLIFFACAALMPPLLRLLEWDSGCGFALIGESGRGKSTLQHAIASLYGGGDEDQLRLLHSWRVAKNGLEPAAPFANDRAFFLDDAQNLPDDDRLRASVLRNNIYMLHHGYPKDRMGYESLPTWLTIFFMCHNQTLQETMADGGQRHNKAAEMRLAEIPCDRKYVVFDDLHGEKSASAFSDALRRRSNRYHGAPFDAFMNELTRQIGKDKAAVVTWLKDRVDSMRHSHLGLLDTEDRVGKYFCLAYAAGRFAEEFCGFLPVSADEIREAVVAVYQSHRRHTAKSAVVADPVAILRRYIDNNYDGLADRRTGRENVLKNYPLGYITDARELKEFSFTNEQFALAVSPFTVKRACDALKLAGLLIRDEGTKPSTQKNVTKRTVEVTREFVHCVSAKILDRNQS